VALLAVLLVGPTTLEFWTKTAILGSLVIACAGRFALVRLLAPFELGDGPLVAIGRLGWKGPAAVLVAAVLVGFVPTASDISTHSPVPVAGLSDGTTPSLALTVGSGPGVGGWVSSAAGQALPPASSSGPATASAHVWRLPPIPTVSIASNVTSFDPSMTQQAAQKMAHDAVLDLVIESEARRSHDLTLATLGASDDGLKEFSDVIKSDIAARKIVEKIYSFDHVYLQLFLPKFATQAARLEGLTLHGTATLITRDSSGRELSRTSATYDKSWGLSSSQSGGSNLLIYVDYTGLTPAP
jgi:hypothetical protein